MYGKLNYHNYLYNICINCILLFTIYIDILMEMLLLKTPHF